MKMLIADDHDLFRDTLLHFINRAMPEARITTVPSFPEALTALQRNPDQDLVLLDLKMPGMNGLEGFKQLREHYPDLRIGMMSGTARNSDVHAVMEMGAFGYFPKTLSGHELVRAIRMVLDGAKFIPIDVATNNIRPSHYNGHANLNREKLTPREKEVLGFLADGASNKEIATALGLQIVTVKLHVRGVCRKLDVRNRTQAAIKAREFDLVN